MLLFLHPQLATGGKGLRPHARLKAAMLPTPLPGSKCSNAQMFKMFKCSKFSNVHNVQNAIKFSHMFKIGNTFLQENYIKNKRTYIMILPIAYCLSHHIAYYRSSTTTSSTATCGSKSLVTSPAFTLADPASYF